MPFLVGSFVSQNIFFASCQRSRLCEKLAAAVPTYMLQLKVQTLVISLAAANEQTLLKEYVLGGSTWSFMCPFLDLYETFNM